MRALALDLSTKTGFAVFDNENLVEYGLLRVKVMDFNVNLDPNKSGLYPFNIVDAANEMGHKVASLFLRIKPNEVIIENTVKGRNRHTQRILEFIHKSTLEELRNLGTKPIYLDPSEWRSEIALRLTTEDKNNNRLVSQGKKRGRVTKKHLSVRFANAAYSLSLKIKDNDIADAICLGRAWQSRSGAPVWDGTMRGGTK